MDENLSKRARSIQQQVSDLSRDIHSLENPGQKTYNIGILGVGNLGERIAEGISTLAQKNDFFHPIGDLYLIGKDLKKQWVFQRESGASRDHRPLKKEHIDNLERDGWLNTIKKE